MPSPAFRAVGDGGFPGFGIDPTIPAGIANNDILLCFVAVHSATLPTMPGGWTRITELSYTGPGNRSGHVFYKRTSGSESAPTIGGITSAEDSHAVIAAYSGCVTSGSPIDVVGSWQDNASSNACTTAAVTLATAETRLIHFIVGDTASANTFTHTGACDTNRFGTCNGNGVNGPTMYDFGDGAVASAGGSGTATMTTDSTQATSSVLFALASVAASSGTTGTIAVTGPLPSIAASGSPIGTGTIAAGLGASVAMSGTPVITGTVDVTVPLPSVSSGSTAVTGNVAASMGGPSVAMVGTPVVTGSVAASLGASVLISSESNSPMQRIIGRPTYGTDTPSLATDGQFRASFAWEADADSWVAVDVGSGPTQLLVVVGSEDNDGGDLRPAWNSGTNAFTAFRIQVSSDSTDGSDGSWTTVVTETANEYIYREYLIPFTGRTFVKFIADASFPMDELELWDASDGATDTWLFLGDSITNRATKRGNQVGVGNQPSFQANIQALTGAWPAQIGGGFVGQGVAFLNTHIDDLLEDFPDVHNWAISIGTNDAAAGGGAPLIAWSTALRDLIDTIQADGRRVHLARIPYTSDQAFGGPPDDFTVLYNGEIDVICSEYGLVGPDLYTHFEANEGELDDGVHPTEEGCDSWNLLWAEAVQGFYAPGNTVSVIAPAPTVALAGSPAVAGAIAASVPRPSAGVVGTPVITGAVAITAPLPFIVHPGPAMGQGKFRLLHNGRTSMEILR